MTISWVPGFSALSASVMGKCYGPLSAVMAPGLALAIAICHAQAAGSDLRRLLNNKTI